MITFRQLLFGFVVSVVLEVAVAIVVLGVVHPWTKRHEYDVASWPIPRLNWLAWLIWTDSPIPTIAIGFATGAVLPLSYQLLSSASNPALRILGLVLFFLMPIVAVLVSMSWLNNIRRRR